jgi:hypothetical protein
VSSDNPLPLHSRTIIAPQVHRLRLRHLALVIVQVTEIVDRVQRRRVLRSQRPLLPLQRSQVHRL